MAERTPEEEERIARRLALRSTNERLIEAVTVPGGRGDKRKTTTNIYLGHNTRGSDVNVPVNRDNQGLTFFTRPRLNLTYDNASVSRILLPFLSGGPDTLQCALLSYLDPVSQRGGASDSHFRGGFSLPPQGSPYHGNFKVPERKSILVDTRSPFIPILSNLLISLSGWPDEVLDTFTSDPGVSKETYSIADTYIRNYGTFDLTATFKNVDGDPITSLIRIWMEYMSNVMNGTMVPYPDTLMEYEIDYQTRIYRIILDSSRSKVRKIMSAAGCFPTANPSGADANYSSDRPYSDDNAQITMPLRCVGAEYNDPILITEFNDASYIFNPELEKAVNGKSGAYVKVAPGDVELFNFEGYPIIDEDDWSFNWWVPVETYNYTKARYF